jgi:hypothetical protein
MHHDTARLDFKDFRAPASYIGEDCVADPNCSAQARMKSHLPGIDTWTTHVFREHPDWRCSVHGAETVRVSGKTSNTS